MGQKFHLNPEVLPTDSNNANNTKGIEIQNHICEDRIISVKKAQAWVSIDFK